MVTVAERFRRKFVELVYMGSNPICHTRNWEYSSVVEQRPVKPFVVSSILSIPATLWGDAMVADEAHNLLVAGSNPAPATTT